MKTNTTQLSISNYQVTCATGQDQYIGSQWSHVMHLGKKTLNCGSLEPWKLFKPMSKNKQGRH